MFHYIESSDKPIRIVPTQQPAVRRSTEAEIAACDLYRETLDESKLLLSAKPTAYLFRELTWDRFERAVRDAGGPPRGKNDPVLDLPRARQIVRQCLVGWDCPPESWPKYETLTEYDGIESVVSMRFIGQMHPQDVSECAMTLFRCLISGKPNEPKGNGEIQAEVSPGN